MKLVDANLLLYAYDSRSVRHRAARRWLEDALSTAEPVRFATVTLLAFVRISTHPRVFERPLTLTEAFELIGAWLARPNAGVLHPLDDHFDRVAELAARAQASARLVMDAHLAQLAIEHGATLFTTDRDFARFDGLRWQDPLAK